jgi:hypothetical protein
VFAFSLVTNKRSIIYDCEEVADHEVTEAGKCRGSMLKEFVYLMVHHMHITTIKKVSFFLCCHGYHYVSDIPQSKEN